MMPLEGLRVIDASTILAGPLCCQILGDFGADVIKVEHPVSGDSMRGHGWQKDGTPLWWKEISRNKRTIGLDLSAAEGAEAFGRLAATADVVVENFRPGTLEKWGVGPDQLHEVNPGLVLVRLTGFGQTGPYARRPGFGTLAEAMSGFAHLTGSAEGPPTLPAFGLADSICGIAASSAAMMALWHREVHGGGGQVIDISILEPIMTAVGPGPTVYGQLGVIEERHGNRSTNNAPRNTYRTSDGSWVAVSTSAQRIAERVLRLVGHPEVIDQPWFASGRGRVRHADLPGGRLDRYPDPGGGPGRVRGCGSRHRADLQRAGHRHGSAHPGDGHDHRGGRSRSRPDAHAQRHVADVGHARVDPVHRPGSRGRHRCGPDRRAGLRCRAGGTAAGAGVVR